MQTVKNRKKTPKRMHDPWSEIWNPRVRWPKYLAWWEKYKFLFSFLSFYLLSTFFYFYGFLILSQPLLVSLWGTFFASTKPRITLNMTPQNNTIVGLSTYTQTFNYTIIKMRGSKIFSWVLSHQRPILVLVYQWYTNAEYNRDKISSFTLVKIFDIHLTCVKKHWMNIFFQ